MEDISTIRSRFDEEIKTAESLESVENLKVKYLGRKSGILTSVFAKLVHLSVEEKRELGPKLNDIKKHVEAEIEKKLRQLSRTSINLDTSIPPIRESLGNLHPITKIQQEMEDIFRLLGFFVEDVPHIESDWYNFESVNMPELHSARDMQDTFYLNLPHPKSKKGKEILLRTHISTIQARTLEKYKPPFASISVGKVFRNESTDASHEHTYEELEGLYVGENVTFAQMSWTLDYVLKQLFGTNIKTRLVPSYFPFTEPSAEMGISCLICSGKGCSVCKQTGWVEILGCGMIHQNVFVNSGYKRNEFSGFAFGMGVSRLALMKYGVPDIRYFSENNLKFLQQF